MRRVEVEQMGEWGKDKGRMQRRRRTKARRGRQGRKEGRSRIIKVRAGRMQEEGSERKRRKEGGRKVRMVTI
jgi:hypothetical protein